MIFTFFVMHYGVLSLPSFHPRKSRACREIVSSGRPRSSPTWRRSAVLFDPCPARQRFAPAAGMLPDISTIVCRGGGTIEHRAMSVITVVSGGSVGTPVLSYSKIL